ncbi:MAG: hypothetical protein HYZ53_08455 [Planctomycetes bacterium]|nr:hypothetical protein [Planctomycetota bacterium]
MRRGIPMLLAAAALAVASAGAAAEPPKKIYSNSYLGKEPPELLVPAGSWLNAKEAPTLKGLRGRVVWLEFSFIH